MSAPFRPEQRTNVKTVRHINYTCGPERYSELERHAKRAGVGLKELAPANGRLRARERGAAAMSAVPKCVVCDRPVANPYAPSALCERCAQGCETCGGDVGFCSHPLRKPVPYTRFEIEERPDGSARVAA